MDLTILILSFGNSINFNSNLALILNITIFMSLDYNIFHLIRLQVFSVYDHILYIFVFPVHRMIKLSLLYKN